MPIRETVTVDDVIDLLNSAVQADPDAMKQLLEARVDCNKDLAMHPTIQVQSAGKDQGRVGLLGVLNGIFGISETGFGIISANFEVICGNEECDVGYQTPRGSTVHDKCPECGNQLQLGKLNKFERMPREYLYEGKNG